MAALDCICETAPEGVDTEPLCTYKTPVGCGHIFKCDRCASRFDVRVPGAGIADRSTESLDFLQACGHFAHDHTTSLRRTLLQNEFAGDFCTPCTRELIKWAPVMADVLSLKAEINNLHRSIKNVKANKDDRPTS